MKVVPTAKSNENRPADLPAPVAASSLEMETMPIGGINLISVRTFQAARIYASLMNRQLDPSQTSADFGDIGFKNATPLTKAEILHALDVQFAWNGVKMVTVDDNFVKLVPLASQ